MADAVTSQTLVDGDKRLVMAFTNVSDGTGESAVTKVDVSTLGTHPITGTACSRVTIQRVCYSVAGMSVSILEDATSDVTLLVLQGDGCIDLRDLGGIPMTGASGITGDIKFTTTGHTAADTYTIILEMTKHYA